ncbi:MAG TPA: energy-coupling factor transporter transmembrane component T [Candidatus Sulfotelmatobacter sp.]|nr:energy-coupling factor transporter transmembrane component T [Candidatus Sulfotelmatobacter sp.]
MSFLPAPLLVRPTAPLARVTGVTRLIAGSLWLVVAAAVSGLAAELVLLAAALLGLLVWSGIPLAPLPGRMWPVALGALGLGLTAAFGSALDRDPALAAIVSLGPLRLTEPGLEAGLALAARILVIGLTSLLVFAPADLTRLADALVQQLRLPDRLAYGSVAAMGLAPLTAADWQATGAARRLRGLAPATPAGRLAAVPGRLLVVLVMALRRGERLALAMDARGFDSGVPRSRFRPVRAGALDLVVLAVAAGVAVVAVRAQLG